MDILFLLSPTDEDAGEGQSPLFLREPKHACEVANSAM